MIAELESAVLAHVRSNKGQRCEEIAALLEQPASLVSVVLRSLRDSGALKSVGNTRGTKWYAVKLRPARL
jgi:predicted transcriptional regulator